MEKQETVELLKSFKEKVWSLSELETTILTTKKRLRGDSIVIPIINGIYECHKTREGVARVNMTPDEFREFNFIDGELKRIHFRLLYM